MAHSLKKRGAVLTEFALITPIMLVFFLLVLQYALIVKANWLVDFAAENACRASMVNEGAKHPDPEVAAQLSLIPATTTSFLRGTQAIEPDNYFLNWGVHYLGSIAKTNVKVDNHISKYNSFYTCTVNYAMELRIPLANHIIGHTTGLLQFGKKFVKSEMNRKNNLNLAEKWSVISGVPHIMLSREVTIRY